MLKDEVLSALDAADGAVVTGGELGERFSVSRAAIWKAINALKENGYTIESIEKRGYRLISTNDILSELSIRKRLHTRFLGNRIEILKTVDSTNTYMKARDLPSMAEGFTVIADGQTGGRGRRNRGFSSLPGEGLYISLLLKPDIPPADTRFLTICAALAVSRALKTACGVESQVKWVNDVYCEGLKICGILTEGAVSVEQQTMTYVVIGMGINTGTLPEEIQGIATSVQRLTGKKPDRSVLAAELLSHMETIYLDLTAHNRKQALLDEYRERQFIFGRTVDIVTPGTGFTFRAVPTEIDDDGALVVRNEAGEILHLCSEEVSLKL